MISCGCREPVRYGITGFAITLACYALTMQLLKKVSDQVTLQILTDLLESGDIAYRVEGAGMNSLMPLPGVIEARVLVDVHDYEAACALLEEMDSGEKE